MQKLHRKPFKKRWRATDLPPKDEDLTDMEYLNEIIFRYRAVRIAQVCMNADSGEEMTRSGVEKWGMFGMPKTELSGFTKHIQAMCDQWKEIDGERLLNTARAQQERLAAVWDERRRLRKKQKSMAAANDDTASSAA